jgi:hypothetical protein
MREIAEVAAQVVQWLESHVTIEARILLKTFHAIEQVLGPLTPTKPGSASCGVVVLRLPIATGRLR